MGAAVEVVMGQDGGEGEEMGRDEGVTRKGEEEGDVMLLMGVAVASKAAKGASIFRGGRGWFFLLGPFEHFAHQFPD